MPSKAFTKATADPLAAVAAAAPTGAIAYLMQAAAPSGWLIADGSTIGSASSGANRADADTAALFALIWALDPATYPILTSTGGASTRGASAAADFAANKRLPLPDLRGEFIRGADLARGIDTGRVLGTPQAEMIGPHTHPANGSTNRNTVSGGSDQVLLRNGTANALNPAVNNNSGTENRPRNVAWTPVVKL